MNAKEFVKKFGIEGAKAKVVELEILEEMGDLMKGQEIVLKQIVEAFELVESYGGYSEVKWQTENKIMYINNQEHDLVKAINLVEQCQC